MVMKNEDKDLKVKPRFTNSKQVPKSRTPVNYMGEEISVPNKENSPNEDRVKIVNQKYKDKQKPLIIKQRKQKLKNKK